MKVYLVGGAVRDKLLGVKSKDLDYVVVLDDISNLTANQGFKIMKDWMIEQGYLIFQSYPQNFTIKAKFPKDHKNKGKDADFVLARKEVGYIEGTREPIIELGNLSDDMIRRDFTINAMAEDENGDIIDIFNGIKHLKDRVLISPQDPNIMLLDDPLRLLRAIRFSITKDMDIDTKLFKAMNNQAVIDKLSKVVSQERIQDELNKMFQYDSIKSMKSLLMLDKFCAGLLEILFKDGYYLKLTNKK